MPCQHGVKRWRVKWSDDDDDRGYDLLLDDELWDECG